jgi:hypothetical protein
MRQLLTAVLDRYDNLAGRVGSRPQP